jgi:hypothetical protein
MVSKIRLLKSVCVLAFAGGVVFLLSGFVVSNASAGDFGGEPIVGLWLITTSYQGTTIDNVFSGWTSDGLEFDQDTQVPPANAILAGYVCYGHWIKLKANTYGLTHPFFDYTSAGVWAKTSGYFNYTVTVSKDGSTFTGKQNGIDGVSGPNPYTGAGGTTYSGVTLSATKIEVNQSLLP